MADIVFSGTGEPNPDLVFGGAGAGTSAPADPDPPGVASLVFWSSAAPSPHLVFGAEPPGDGESDKDATAVVAGVLPLPSLRAKVSYIAQVRVTGQFPGPAFAASAKYLTMTQRPTVSATRAPWQETGAQSGGFATGHKDSTASPHGWAAQFQAAQKEPAGMIARQPRTSRSLLVTPSARFQGGTGHRLGTGLSHQDSTPVWRTLRMAFRDGTGSRCSTAFRQQDGDRRKRPNQDAHWQVARFLSRLYQADHQIATPLPKGWAGRFQDAVPPPPGIDLPPWSETPPGPGPYAGPAHLLFEYPFGHRGTDLLFNEGPWEPNAEQPPTETAILPIRRVYMVINNVSLYRISDNALVPALGLSLSLDADSWTWGFNASLPVSAQALVEPTDGPVELRVTINGTEFRVLAENISRERTFGESSIRISGRGHNAVLAAPYAPVMTFSNQEGRTARQLMDDVLTLNGVPLGWTVDWGLTDWNVPAGAFARQGTWIEALTSIAQAAGGYLLPHASAKTLRVRHRYPAAPWEWGTRAPDFVLPVDAVARESLRWIEKPAYNRVFVSGQDVGVLGQVTRAGTAGDVLAPMVIDALITAAAAARQRGLAVLADTGHQIEVSLRLPVLPETEVIEPGAFVEYQDGSVTRRGLVRSTQIEAGMPEVWQTLGVQAYA
ncbi:hypothetical protein JI739_19050 [Ramlibacter sp. AW1]|uniref:Uncharacterized protein n=1 Tax=Ramlibacter aurantiacus TaxID=2801330 RepID=A0A937D7X0_9BURK|nr:hypothetical protein [Ramlibacter aurantiacus]MBL0422453.1 hypothetical protein [Ramlibacter aurantiacus]